MAGVMNSRKVDEMFWTWEAEYLIGPGVFLVIFGAAALPWFLTDFNEDVAIMQFLDKHVSLSA